PGPMPNATIGVPYVGPLVQDGSPPFTTNSNSNPPPGLQFVNGQLTGTPTGSANSYQVFGTDVDFWGVAVDFGTSLQIQPPIPTLSNVFSLSGATIPYGTLTNLIVLINANANPAFVAQMQFLDNNVVIGSAPITPSSGSASLNGVFLQ